MNYAVEIKESSMELTARDRIKMKDVSNAIKLDEATQLDSIRIAPVGYVVLDVHNEKSDNTDYEQYLILTADDKKYVTGSKSFFTTFRGIWDELAGEDFELDIYRKDSKNYTGKQFITCSLV